MSSNASSNASSKSSTEIPANAENKYTVTKQDLPLHCPMDGMTTWNSHPRVFISLEKTGKGKCPYCGADYELEAD